MLKMSTVKNSTESFVPVKAIINNMIELDSGFKVAGVKVSPRNIYILDSSDQLSIIDGLKDVYNTIDFEFWLVIADRPVDISTYVAELQMMYNKSQSPVIRKLINQDMKKADDFNDEVSDIEFYLLFKEKDVEKIQKKVRNLITNLANAGITASQANNEDLRSVLDNFLNGGDKTEFGTVLA